jgi:hypothetical protein
VGQKHPVTSVTMVVISLNRSKGGALDRARQGGSNGGLLVVIGPVVVEKIAKSR